MTSFITRYFSSLWALITYPIRFVWRWIVHFFPERDFSVMDTHHGNVYSYHQSSFWRFTRFCGKVCLVIWASWSTYVFVYHRPLLQSRTQQIEDLKVEHAKHISDMIAYTKKFNEIARELNMADDEILLSDDMDKKQNLIKKRLNAWAELDVLAVRLRDSFEDEDYVPMFKSMSEMSVAYDLTVDENDRLTDENEFLSDMMRNISDADNQIVEIATKLSDENIEYLKSNLKSINNAIATLNLTQNKMVIRANRFESNLMGDVFSPVELATGLDDKYQDLADKLKLWHGLDRLNKMLPLGAPVSKTRITSEYGVRADPFTGESKNHKGIDFAGKIGTELYTVSPGRIISAGERVGYGKTVEIDHGLGFSTLYAHMSEINVKRGDWVHPGEVIGLAGNSGRSTGPHLHYEIRYNGRQFNPTSFVKHTDIVPEKTDEGEESEKSEKTEATETTTKPVAEQTKNNPENTPKGN